MKIKITALGIIAGVAGSVGLLAGMVELGIQPVMWWQHERDFAAITNEMQSERLDRLCEECMSKCMVWCPDQLPEPDRCYDFCRLEVCKECG